MIEYIVRWNLISYVNPDKIDMVRSEKIFEGNEPIKARKDAFAYFDDLKSVVEEGYKGKGTSLSYVLSKGNDSIEFFGLGIQILYNMTVAYKEQQELQELLIY